MHGCALELLKWINKPRATLNSLETATCRKDASDKLSVVAMRAA